MASSLLKDPLLSGVPLIDGYRVLEPAVLVDKLPEGGMAAVYRGLHLDLKVDVAVKVLKRGNDAQYTPQAVARFRQEAEQAARLDDPNLVRIYDFPANRLGLLYIVMEYVDGETLESRIHRKGRLQPGEAATIAAHAARGLQTAHAEGVVHRDIKPPNILISKRGRVKLTDLGIAKAQDSASGSMTQEITLLGTPQYMAPELWRGARFASPASDVYALGATLGFMLAGRHVLDGGEPAEIMHRSLTEGFPDLAVREPQLPEPLTDLVRRCTTKGPEQRPTIDELLSGLSQYLSHSGGEVALADANAGSTSRNPPPPRVPSRTDLDTIRQRLDAEEHEETIPETLRLADDPDTVAAAMQAFLGGDDEEDEFDAPALPPIGKPQTAKPQVEKPRVEKPQAEKSPVPKPQGSPASKPVAGKPPVGASTSGELPAGKPSIAKPSVARPPVTQPPVAQSSVETASASGDAAPPASRANPPPTAFPPGAAASLPVAGSPLSALPAAGSQVTAVPAAGSPFADAKSGAIGSDAAATAGDGSPFSESSTIASPTAARARLVTATPPPAAGSVGGVPSAGDPSIADANRRGARSPAARSAQGRPVQSPVAATRPPSVASARSNVPVNPLGKRQGSRLATAVGLMSFVAMTGAFGVLAYQEGRGGTLTNIGLLLPPVGSGAAPKLAGPATAPAKASPAVSNAVPDSIPGVDPAASVTDAAAPGGPPSTNMAGRDGSTGDVEPATPDRRAELEPAAGRSDVPPLTGVKPDVFPEALRPNGPRVERPSVSAEGGTTTGQGLSGQGSAGQALSRQEPTGQPPTVAATQAAPAAGASVASAGAATPPPTAAGSAGEKAASQPAGGPERAAGAQTAGSQAAGSQAAGSSGGTPPAPTARPPKTSADFLARVASSAGDRRWGETFDALAAAQRLASPQQRGELGQAADRALLAFRTDQPDLAMRRRAFPNLSPGLLNSLSGVSGVAALVAAEQMLVVRDDRGVSKLDTTDRKNGFETIINYLALVKPDAPPAAVAEARAYLPRVRIQQAAFLADQKNWQALAHWVAKMSPAQIADTSAPGGGPFRPDARTSTPSGHADAGRLATEAQLEISSALLKLWRANDPSERRRLFKDDSAGLTPWIEAGVAPAAVLAAESLFTYEGDPQRRRLVVTGSGPDALDRVGQDCNVALTTATDAGLVEAAARYRLDAALAASREAQDRRAWNDVVTLQGRSLALASDKSTAAKLGPTVADAEKRFAVGQAEQSLMRFRADAADLDKRRSDYPTLGAQVKPLADAGVDAARLVQAERFLRLLPPDGRAAAVAEDPDFRQALELLTKVIVSTTAPADVKAAALDRQWEVYADFVRRETPAVTNRPDRTLERLKLLAMCDANDIRENDYESLVDQMFPAADPNLAGWRVKLADARMQVQEGPDGRRKVGQGKASVLQGLRKSLEQTTQSPDLRLRATSHALLGELALAADPTPQGRESAFDHFREGLKVERPGELADPIALMGVGWFYELDDGQLARPPYAGKSFEDLRQLTLSQRQQQALAFYRTAARSGDAFANFLAGKWSWTLLPHAEDVRQSAFNHLRAAALKDHKKATELLRTLGG